MPEEKKESFTFSDKIKNSKAAGNKSFAKSSSKIGRDGKPKQTLFERTRRDAPFFIAALVALLLLPFLYKFSGQASEETLLTPSSEESTFTPERYGFDTAMVEDPDGQIAQFAGRDSLKLIKGWGDDQEEDYGRDDMDFDASAAASYEGEGEYDARRAASTNIDEEENITNIYKRRARAGTRAAFRRTQIGSLNPASMRRGNGSRLGINNWGGSMKDAAKKVRPNGPTEGPKPVSLQPLRAGGPARSSFGSGAAQAARKSLDNMGKANAREALRDSYVKPVDPTRMGGLDLFSDGRSGGSGKLDHHINIGKGETPWWWDMMKTRMQKEWEARFERKWDWIKWADKLAQNILAGLANCLITGEDDGSMGSMFGHAAGGGKVAKCGNLTEEEWNNCKPCTEIGKFGSHTCKTYLDTLTDNSSSRKKGWQPGPSSGGGAAGFLGVRLGCLGIAGGGYAAGDLGLSEGIGTKECVSLDKNHYSVHPEGAARKWNVYHYIVARNYVPVNMHPTNAGKDVAALDRDLRYQLQLCSVHGNNLKMDRKSSGALAVKYNLSPADKAYIERLEQDGTENGKKTPEKVRQEMEKYAQDHAGSVYKDNDEQLTISESYDPESLDDACVIYVAYGKELDWEKGFKPQMINALAELIVDGVNNGRLQVDGITKNDSVSSAKVRNAAENAFNHLDLMFIESMASKKKLGKATLFKSGHSFDNGGDDMMLPMPYWQFYAAYLSRYGSTLHNGSRVQVSKRKERTVGVDTIYGAKCYFHNDVKIACASEEVSEKGTLYKAIVTLGRGYKAGNAGADAAKSKGLTVKGQFRPMAGGEGPEQDLTRTFQKIDENTFQYTFTKAYSTTTATSPNDAKDLNELVGSILWKVYRSGINVVSTTCDVNLTGDPITPFIERTQCNPGDVEFSPDPKVEGQCQQQRTCSQDGQWGDWMKNPKDPDCGNNPPPPGPSNPHIVHFYDQVTKVPCGSDITNGPRRVESAQGCLQWEACKLTVDRALLLPLDADTKRYLAAAKAKFDKANESQRITLDYNESSVSVSNLIDAIMIDPDNGTVPANTACLLGKTIGANAKDPQAATFDNLFGAFLAFIGYDASSFPSRKTYSCGVVVDDKRFSTGTHYWWGGYVDQRDRRCYEDQVNGRTSPWRDFPLRELQTLRGKFLPTSGDKMTLSDQENRVKFHNDYADLMRREPCTYESGQTVSRKNVLLYVSRLCEYGEQQKPQSCKTSGGAGKKPTTQNNTPQHKQQHGRICPDGNC